MGQWMSGGMLMIGDMFNNELKAKVDRICRDVADAVAKAPPARRNAAARVSRSGDWWPAEFGTPSSVGAQNAMRYAFFPTARRLVLDEGGVVSTFDTGKHIITGVSQQQSGSQTIAFSGPGGPIPIEKLRRLDK